MNHFLHDFNKFLQFTQEKKVEYTKTGNLNLKTLELCGMTFLDDRYRYLQSIEGRNGKKLFSRIYEYNYPYAGFIKDLSLVMHLVYKRRQSSKRYILLSKNGKGFLKQEQKVQLKEMFAWYCLRFNWEYNHFSRDITPKFSVKNIQQNQMIIWSLLLESYNCKQPLTTKSFTQLCMEQADFATKTVILMDDEIEILENDLTNIILKELLRFGLIDAKLTKSKFGLEKIISFKLNSLGSYILEFVTTYPL